MHKFLEYFVLRPLLFFIKVFMSLWFKLTGRDPDGSIQETIEELIEQEQDQGGRSIDSDERRLLVNVLDLKDTTVGEVMIARAEIVAVDIATDPQAMLDLMFEKNMSLILVYKNHLDNLLGYILFMDLTDIILRQEKDVQKIIKEVEFVSPSMRTLDLLLKMRETGEKIAIVVDEYGSVDGLVTFSELIEEIIGDIHELESINPPGRIEIDDNKGEIIVDGHVKIKDVQEEVGINWGLENINEDVSTIAGVVSAIAGRVPSRGELIKHQKVEFLILDASPRNIRRVCIKQIKV